MRTTVSSGKVGESVQGCQHLLEELAQRREAFIEATNSTVAEGEVLISDLSVTQDGPGGSDSAAVTTLSER